MPHVPLKNIIQSTCHIVYHVSKYAQSYGGGGFSGFFFFTKVKTKNDIYYRSEKHY